MKTPAKSIAFQGIPGAYSEIACRKMFPACTPLPTASFEDLLAAVRDGKARYAMTPIDNSIAGRVADIHHLLPHSGLFIVGEYFLRVEHQLLAPKHATLKTIKEVYSHVHALGQCRKHIRALRLKPVVYADTAKAAADVALRNDPSAAAIASELAGKLYGLKVLKRNMEDADHNTTRFVVLAREPIDPGPKGNVITSFLFATKSVPAALYKAIGGFATNGINITKLESYLTGSRFEIAQFYMDVEGHPSERSMKLALEELGFFSKEIKTLGVYRASPFRYSAHTN